MKILTFTFLLLLICFQPLTAQEIGKPGDFRTWHLPYGAIARLGKGKISGSASGVDISKDGAHLAVASDLGVWIYEIPTNRVVAYLPRSLRRRSFYKGRGVSVSRVRRYVGNGMMSFERGHRGRQSC